MMRLAPLLLVIAAAPARAAYLAAADAAFDKGLYQQALSGYEAVLASGAAADRAPALWRACESEALLFRYGAAYERLRAATLPGDALSRSRFAILKAELGREYLKQYEGSQPADVEEGAADATHLTPAQLRAEVEGAFFEAWKARELLAGRPVAEDSYYLDVAKSDRARWPTLLDFLVERWAGYLLSEAEVPEGARKPAPASFIKESYDGPAAAGTPPAALAAAVYEAAARLGGEEREAAREAWRVRRALVPFDAPGKVAALPDESAGLLEAAALLQRWRAGFKTPDGRAEAGFEAAGLLDRAGRLEEAAKLCDGVAAGEPGTRGAGLCERLAAEVRMPALGLSTRVVPPPGARALTLSTRNLERVNVRLYRTSPKELRRMRGVSPDQPWSGVLGTPTEELVKGFLSRKPDAAWTVPTPSAPHVATETVVDLPSSEPGLYMAAASGDADFEPGASLLTGALVNVTDLVLLGDAGFEGLDRDFIPSPGGSARRTSPAFRFYAFDGRSGRPAAKAALDLRAGQEWSWSAASRVTDELGRAELPATASLAPDSWQAWQADALASRGASWAYWASPLSLGYSSPSHLRVLLETDRPVYRPGQEVRWKATVLELVPRGWRPYGGAALKVHFQDANGQRVKDDQRTLSTMGSAAGGFEVPGGRLLGNWSLSAEVSDGRRGYSGWTAVAVEEYKRPEFELSVDESSGAWRYAREASVSGKASYYFGGPVPDAQVTFTVTRETWRPWFCWWWSWRPLAAASEVARGTAKTGSDGTFRFAFTPQAADPDEKDPLPARFVVKVSAHDAGGRTIEAERTFTAGAKGALLRLDPEAGFAASGRPFAVDVKLVSLDETALAGKGRFELVRLLGEPAAAPAENEWGGQFPPEPSLEEAFAKVPDGPEVRSGTLRLLKDKGARAALGKLAPGAYRLRVSAEDPWGGSVEQDIVVLAADPAKPLPLKLAAVSLPEHATYAVGDTARVLLGSSELDALTHVEVWGGAFLLERRALEGKGPRVVSFKLGPRHKGGVTVRWFGVEDYAVRGGEAALAVPWKEKELKVAVSGARELSPGQKAAWRLSVKTASGKPAAGEATLRMYDRSLEYYAKSEGPDLAGLYPPRPAPEPGQGSQRELPAAEVRVERGVVAELLKAFQKAVAEPLPPALRLNRGRVYGGRFRLMGLAGVREEAADAMELEGAAGAGGGMVEARAMAAAPAAVPMDAAKKAEGPSAPAVHARADFSETALFAPQVPVRQGRASLPFKAPERLTSWRVTGYVLTKDAAYGLASTEAVTRKELMVRVETPRYLREGDEAVLKAVVSNGTGRPMSGSAWLGAREGKADAAGRLGLAGGEQRFQLAAHGTAGLSWKVKAPEGLTTFTVTATARAGKRADAETRELPILPARQRLVESVVVALSGSVQKKLTAPKLTKDDPSRQDELVELQVDPQLALTVLNAVPFLVQYPYECVEQTLNRWLPSAILSKVYANHPAIAKAAAKVPKRTTITPPWEQDDPKRLMTLMETPYVGVSQGISSAWPIVDMLDPEVVKKHEASALERLRAAQLADGGFPWFPGGSGDLYMTLYVLDGLAEGRHFGVELPADVARKALGYAMRELPHHLKPEEDEVSALLYAAYVVTSFPEDLKSMPDVPRVRELARAWLDYADKHADAMTRLGKAYASYAYRRLGERRKAELYLDRAMDAARTDELTGTYWTPEKDSWHWYNDDLETHAFLIRALQTLRPKDPRLPGMVQWLLFNRKGSVWKSTKASAAAVYALLDYMRKTGSLTRGDTFTVRWGGLSDAARVGPADWLARPLRWDKRGQRGPADAEATVTKSGPGFAFASLTHVYSTLEPEEASAPGLLTLDRRFFRRVKKGDAYHLEPLKSGDAVRVGDEVVVRLTVTSRGQLEYVHLKDPRGAGFEAQTLRSGWAWDGLARYEEPRDSLTNYFVSWLPQGEYKLQAVIRPTTPGTYRVGAAVIQLMYAPEFAAHSAGFELKVEE